MDGECHKCYLQKASQFSEGFMKIYDEDSNIGYDIDVKYPGKLHELYNYLHFLPERMKIQKLEELVSNLHDREEYFIHIRNLKQALNRGLVLEKVQKVMKFNQKIWPRSYIDLNTELRKNF